MRRLFHALAILVAITLAPAAFADAAAKIKAHGLANGGPPSAAPIVVDDDGPGLGGGY